MGKMRIRNLVLSIAVVLTCSIGSMQCSIVFAATETPRTFNVLDEFDPFDLKAEELLKKYDQIYEQETGSSANLNDYFDARIFKVNTPCMRAQCAVWAQIVKSQQKLYLYLNGQPQQSWLVSTGAPGWETPNLDTHPDGRIYDAYTSRQFPGPGYQDLGNMPYAVFVQGGIAIHGTGEGSWSKLGSVASHGCIRLHPDHALQFNRLVRQHGYDR